MKYAVIILVVAQLLNARVVLSQAGNLDNTFGTGGEFTFPNIPAGIANAIALQPDGKIVATGESWLDFATVRCLANGSPDSSFGVDGIVSLNNLTGPIRGAYALALQIDGKIIVAGADGDNTILIRRSGDGSLDSTFGLNGIVEKPAPYWNHAYRNLAIQADGKIIAAGYALNQFYPYDEYLLLDRYNSDGSIDNTFLRANDPQNFHLRSLLLQPDGKILMGGGIDSGEFHVPYLGIIRCNENGAPDSTFGTNGISAVQVGQSGNALSLALQPDGKIIAGGASLISQYIGQLLLTRFNSDGTLDSSFGQAGIVTDSIDRGTQSIAIQTDGKILAQTGYGYFSTARFNSSGTPDSTWGDNGRLITIYGAHNTVMLIQPDHKILCAGEGVSGYGFVRYLSGLELGILNLTTSNPPSLIYPNPIHSQATLQYTLENEERITISLFDLQGKSVQTFFTSQSRAAGEHKEELNFNPQLSNGNYVLSISNGVNSQAIKIEIAR